MKTIKVFEVESAPQDVIDAVAWFTGNDAESDGCEDHDYEQFVTFVVDTSQELDPKCAVATMCPRIWNWLLAEGACEGETVLLEISPDLF